MRQINENKDMDGLTKISSSNITHNDTCLPFVEQLNRFIKGNMPTGDVLIVSEDEWLTRTGVSNT